MTVYIILHISFYYFILFYVAKFCAGFADRGSQCIFRITRENAQRYLSLRAPLKKNQIANRGLKSRWIIDRLRHHIAWRGPEGYNKEPWHKRSSQNDQRQGKKEDSNSSKAKLSQLELKSHYQIFFLFFIFGGAPKSNTKL